VNEFVEILLAAWEYRPYRILISLVIVEVAAIAAMMAILSWQTGQRRRYEKRRREWRDMIQREAASSEKSGVQWFEDQNLECTASLRDALMDCSGTEYEEMAHRIWRNCGFGEKECRALVRGPTRKRLVAIRCLYVFSDPSAEEWVIEALEKEEDHRFRVAAVQVLARLDSGRGVALALEGVEIEQRTMEQPIYAAFRALSTGQLETLINNGVDGLGSRVRRVLYQVAAERGVESVVAGLEPMVNHDDMEERLGAARISASLGGDIGCRLLSGLLEDPKWEVRAQAAKGLGLIGNSEVVPKLRQAARDEQFWVRENARWALTELGGGAGEIQSEPGDGDAAMASDSQPSSMAGVSESG